MPTYRGKFSPDFFESDLMKGGDFAWMPGPTPNVYVKDAQNQFPGKNQIIPDRGGWADDFSRGFPAQSPFRGKNHPKY